MLSPTGLSPTTAGFSNSVRLTPVFITARQAGRPNHKAPTTPPTQPLPGITRQRFSLIRFRSPLLTESQLFSLPVGTEMFHFPTFPPHTLYIQVRVTRHNSCGVTPFGHPRITARLTAPRGLSQPPTSFIGSWYQGIHHVLLKTYTQKPRKKMLASTMQISNNKPTTNNTQANPGTNPSGTHTAGREKKQTPVNDQPVPSGPNSAPTATNNHTPPVPTHKESY